MAAVAAFAGAAEAVVDNEIGRMMEVRNTEQVLAQAEDVWTSL